MPNLNRRHFLARASLVAGTAAAGLPAWALTPADWATVTMHPISLAPLLRDGTLDISDYPGFVRETFGILHCEYDTQFVREKRGDLAFFKRLRKRAEEAGVRNTILLVSPETPLTSESDEDQNRAVDEHLQWAETASALGCHTMRVQSSAKGERAAALERTTATISRLLDKIGPGGPAVFTENIGGLSRDPEWLAALVDAVGPDRLGLVADFGNFAGDKVAGMRTLMPRVRALCAKSARFDEDGNESEIDYPAILKVARDAGFSGEISIEYVGKKPGPVEGVRATQELLARTIESL